MAIDEYAPRSRSPTLRASHDNGFDPEKLPESMQGDQNVIASNNEKRKSGTWRDQEMTDPFADEQEGDVKYREYSMNPVPPCPGHRYGFTNVCYRNLEVVVC